MPRPFALHENRRAAIIALASHGLSNRAIARYVCCSPSTIQNTADRDPAFRQELETARFTFVLQSHRDIRKHAPKSWRAANILLERSDRENFGRRRPDSVTPAQQARQFKTWTKALAEALPPEHRAAIEDKAARLSQDLAAARDADCPRYEFADDFIPPDPAWDTVPPLPLADGRGDGAEVARGVCTSESPRPQSVSPRPPGQAEVIASPTARPPANRPAEPSA